MAGGKLISTGVEFPDATTQTTSGLPLTGGTMTGALTTTGFTSTGIDDNATSTAITIDASENVGIGNSAPMSRLEVGSGSGNAVSDSRAITISTNGQYGTDAAVKYMNLDFAGNADAIKGRVQSTERTGSGNGSSMSFSTANGSGVLTERIRLLENGGITFNGDTAAANALDDYETGTWTPSVGGTATYFTQTGTYTKVGNQVTIKYDFTINSIGTGSVTTVSGLPFTSSAASAACTIGYYSSLATSATALYHRVDGSSTSIVNAITTTAAVTTTNQASIYGNVSRVIGSATYLT